MLLLTPCRLVSRIHKHKQYVLKAFALFDFMIARVGGPDIGDSVFTRIIFRLFYIHHRAHFYEIHDIIFLHHCSIWQVGVFFHNAINSIELLLHWNIW